MVCLDVAADCMPGYFFPQLVPATCKCDLAPPDENNSIVVRLMPAVPSVIGATLFFNRMPRLI
jgi:hypothetical protein